MPTVTFNHVFVEFEGRPILNDIHLELREHRIGIIGENGSGKSTLLRLINGLGSPSTGTVLVDGRDVAKHGKEIRRQVGFVFSDADNQIVMPTVREDIALSLRRFKLPRQERDARVRDALARYNLTRLADQSPHVLSGGEKQLLALAAVTVIEPEIILADEPTTLLDLRNRSTIERTFRALPQQLIVVTHDLDLLADFNRVLCIHEHSIVADGTPEETIAYYRALMEDSGGAGECAGKAGENQP